MIQHINLLSKRKKRRAFVWLAAWALVAVLLVLLGFALTTEWRLQRLRAAEARTQQSIAELRVALETKRREAGLEDSQALARQMATLRSQIEARRGWAELLQRGDLGSPQGYSRWLEVLAQVHEDGVWLQGLDIGKGGQAASVTGKATSAEAVMRYIAQVNEAFGPMGVQFSSMEIVQDASAADPAAVRSPGILKFKIF
jgi:Tfp pilus assembly protein PilN